MDSNLTSDFLSGFEEGHYPEEFLLRYEALECLSHGPGCETLLVCDRENGRLLVAKCYERGHILFDFTEPEELRRLSHPGLPSFIGEIRSQEFRCILREYVQGQTLSALAQENSLTPDVVRTVGIQLCEILRYLHNRVPPVIHRDIKPQNIVVRADGSLALIDLGISRLYEADAQKDTVLCGTQDFAPPEQYGFLQTDCRSDIYSLGILLAWMLTGKAAPLSRVQTPLERVIAQCTAFAPDDRFDDAHMVERALKKASPFAQRRRIIVTAGTGVVVLLLLAALVLKWPSLSNSLQKAPENTSVAETVSETDFTQPVIEEAVRLMLGKDASDPISPEELASVTELYITMDVPCADIQSFYETHEKQARAGQNSRGAIRSLEDLKLLPNLRILCIASEQITDITPLESLTGLYQLELRMNDVSDISPLTKLPRLAIVGLNSNPVTDISPLRECKELKNLDLCNADRYDASVISTLGDFDFLDISNKTDSYLYLGGKKISYLKIAYTSLNDLSVLNTVTGLQLLEIPGTEVTDISPLINHPGLTELKLSGIPVTDFSVLLQLTKLETVTVSEDAQSLVAPLAEKGGFNVSIE